MLSTKNFAVGAYNNLGAGFFNGTIDEVRVWNRLLSSEEVLLLNASKLNITSSERTTKGDTWTIQAWAVDTDGLNGTKAQSSITMLNSPPSATSPSITPNPAYVDTDLSASSIYSDPDSESGSLWFHWFVDGVLTFWEKITGLLSGQQGTSTLQSGNFTKGQNITVQATPNDGTINGTQVNASRLISNSNPIINSLYTIPNGSVIEGKQINISFNITDLDLSDTLNVTIKWFTNNNYNASYSCINMSYSPFGNLTRNAVYINSSCSLPTDAVIYGQSWKAEITALDGSNVTKRNSSAITIDINPPPVINVISIKPQIARANFMLNLSFNITDISASPIINATIKWFTNDVYNSSYSCTMATSPFKELTSGAYYNNNSCGVPINSIVRSQVWNAELSAYDGTTIVVQNSTSITIFGTAPGQPSVYLNTSSAFNYTVDNLTAHITSVPGDADNDSLHYFYNWLNNGTSDTLVNTPMESNASGKIYDFSGYDQDLMPMNGVLFNHTAGYDDKGAWQFDGADDRIEISNNALLNFSNNSFSIEVVFKKMGNGNPYPAGGISNIVSKYSADYSGIIGAYGLVISNPSFIFPGSIIMVVSKGDNNPNIAGTPPLNNDQWYHVVGTFDSTTGNISIYLDGVLSDSNTLFGTDNLVNTNNLNLTIGGFSNDPTYGTSSFNGTIDLIRIYNRSLSAAEVEQRNNMLMANKTNEWPAGSTRKNQNWSVQSWAFDIYGMNGSISSTSSVYINNMYPSATAANFTPEIVLVNLSINATSVYTDPDLDTGNLWFHWFVNNVLTFWEKFSDIISGSDVSSILQPGNYSSNDNVTVQVTPNDNIINGTAVNNSILIGNSQPYINSIDIAPQIAYQNIMLNSSFNITDINLADTLNVTIKWFTHDDLNDSYGCDMTTSPFRNIARNAVYNNNSCGVPINAITKGQVWIAEVTVWDNTDSFSFNSSGITISNYPPSAPVVYFNATSVFNTTDDNLTAWIITDATDAEDGSNLDYAYNFKKNGNNIYSFYSPMEGTNETLYDFSGENNNGVVNNGALFNSTAGYNGQGAYQFDGADDYITTTGSIGFKSFETWIYPRNVIPYQAIISKMQLGNGWWLNLNNSQIEFYFRGGVPDDQNRLHYSIDQDRWYHIAGSFNCTDAFLYINGILVNSTKNPSCIDLLATSRAMTLAAYIAPFTGAPESFFNGTIDEVKIYNYSISQEEVTASYKNRSSQIISEKTSVNDVWTVQAWVFDTDGINSSYSESSITIGNLPAAVFNYGADGDLSVGSSKAFWPWVNITLNNSMNMVSVNFTVTDPLNNLIINNVNGTNYDGTYWKTSTNLTPLYAGNWIVRADYSALNSHWFYGSIQFNVTIKGGIELTSWKILDDSYGANTSIRLNFTRGTSIEFMNCSVWYPNGTSKMGWAEGSLVEYANTYEVWDCPYFFNDANSTLYPGYTSNISVGNADANYSFSDPHWIVKDRWVWNPIQLIYSFANNPPDTLGLNLSLSTFTKANLSYRFFIEGWDPTLGSYNLAYSKLNFTNATNGIKNLFNITTQPGSEGTYSFNISMYRYANESSCPTCSNRKEVIPFLIYNHPPAGKVGMNLSSGQECSLSTRNCDWVPSPYYSFSPYQDYEWYIYNSGYYNLTGCSANLTGELAAHVFGHYYFTESGFSLEPQESRSLGLYVGPSDIGSWIGYVDINCNRSNQFGDPTHLLPDLMPRIIVRTISKQEYLAGGGGGGGGGPISNEPEPELKNITEAKCGNFECEAGENATSCPLDCVAPLKPRFNLDEILCLGSYKQNCSYNPLLVQILFFLLIAGFFVLFLKRDKKNLKRKDTLPPFIPLQRTVRPIRQSTLRRMKRQQAIGKRTPSRFRTRPLKTRNRRAQKLAEFLGLEKQ
jgi:phosphatidylethanolamine-binding protein (PEBP) family uncharacterized protein